MNAQLEPQRQQMISQQIRCWSVLDENVLQAMMDVPRELFVPVAYRDLAFADTSIPLGEGEHTFAPKVEGRLLQALALKPSDEVLLVGVGNGYLAACMARLAKQVRCVEPRAVLAEQARKNLLAAVTNNVSVEVGEAAALNSSNTYDAIIVAASLPVYDEHFERMLKQGGRLVMITGLAPVMQVNRITRLSVNQWHREVLFETSDVPVLDGATKPQAFVF
ncbi:MAG TPA: protein-L-isoaspartate O-methyltransferase [Steroidobacteraceae bacterium]|jgi:protein-L-isoaspartate(D-aspartate) O-methyltransferase|nr:protein-L-isoaspartate O-methyltransferase [Steroidobacteraceae bacterium]